MPAKMSGGRESALSGAHLRRGSQTSCNPGMIMGESNELFLASVVFAAAQKITLETGTDAQSPFH